MFVTKDSNLDTILERVWADTQISNSLRASDPAWGSTKLIARRNWGAVSPSTCASERHVCTWPPGSLLASQPTQCLSSHRKTFSLQLQSTESTELPSADMLLSRGAPRFAARISGGNGPLIIPRPPAFRRSAMQGASQASPPQPAASADRVGGCRYEVIRRQ